MDPSPAPATEPRRVTSKLGVVRGITDSRASIHTLPRELLEIMFRACLASASDSDEISRVLETLSSICSHWRQVALSTPILWTNISFGPIPYTDTAGGDVNESCRQYEANHRHMLSRTRTALERSGNAGIDLTLHWQDGQRVPLHLCRQSESEASHLIRPHLQRCRTISLDNYGHLGSNAAALLPLQGSLPRLQNFSLRLLSGFRARGERLVQIMDANAAPRLRCLEITGDMDYASGLDNLPLELLSHVSLYLSKVNGPRVIAIVLARAVAVEELSLLGDMSISDWPQRPEAYALPRLRSLSLSDGFLDRFSQVDSPSLERLEVHRSASRVVPVPQHPLSSILHSVSIVQFKFAHVRSVLKPHPTLRTVRVTLTEDDDDDDLSDILALLLRIGGMLGMLQRVPLTPRAPILPNLERLEIWEVSVARLRLLEVKIAGMLDARPKVHVALRFDQTANQDTAARSNLNRMKAEYGERVTEVLGRD